MLDDSIKTILIDDSHNVKEVIKAICERIGINNPDEFSLVVENLQADDPKNATLRKVKLVLFYNTLSKSLVSLTCYIKLI
jgi:talin